ncbi:MAG: hypothetical protein ACR2M4_05575 [Actinomycetota bacterium]
MSRSRTVAARPVRELLRRRKLESGLSWPEFAMTLGICTRTLERVNVNPDVAIKTADRLAIRLGTHPILLWGDDWYK